VRVRERERERKKEKTIDKRVGLVFILMSATFARLRFEKWLKKVTKSLLEGEGHKIIF
jgi:hypothetical protein